MKRSLLPVLSCLLLSALPGTAAPLPNLALSCDKGKTVAACLNRKVTLKAPMAGHSQSSADTVMQHPIMTSPIVKEHQSYTVLSANLGQVVVISKTAISCAKAEIKGTLSRYTMGCGEGQSGKCTYSNYVLRADSFKCTK